MFLYSISFAAAVYLIAGWYIFKTDEYRLKDIIFTQVSIIFFLIPTFIGFVYKTIAWPGSNAILQVAVLGGFALLIISIIWFFNHQKFPNRKLLGFNILARVVVLIFLANLLGTIMRFIE